MIVRLDELENPLILRCWRGLDAVVCDAVILLAFDHER